MSKDSGRARYAAACGLLCCVAAGLSGTILSGCPAASSSSKMTKQEEANFKGGPMPADFKPGAAEGPPKGTPK